MNTPLHHFLQQGFFRMRRQGLMVTFITLALATFIASLYWLDPEVQTYDLGFKILFFAVVTFFYAVGFLMLYAVLTKNKKQFTELMIILETKPESIHKVHHVRVVNRAVKSGGENAIGSQHYLRIEFEDGKIIQLSYPYKSIHTVLDLMYQKLPHCQPRL